MVAVVVVAAAARVEAVAGADADPDDASLVDSGLAVLVYELSILPAAVAALTEGPPASGAIR